MTALQRFLTRLFNLKKPLDKRIIWLGIGLISLFVYLIGSGMNDSSSGASLPIGVATEGKQAFDGQTLTKPTIYVHIVGFVKRPGLYKLDSGSRLADAVFAADGFTAKADESSVNLARLLTDGEQVVVAGVGSGASASGFSTGASQSSARTTLVNINRADAATVETLPGVGPTLAGRILDWRAANGGYKTKADLQKVAGIGDKLYAKIKDLVVL